MNFSYKNLNYQNNPTHNRYLFSFNCDWIISDFDYFKYDFNEILQGEEALKPYKKEQVRYKYNNFKEVKM